MSKRHILIMSILLVLVVGLSIWTSKATAAEVWNASFEGSPADGDAISAGATKIRDTRLSARERMEVEHFVGGTAASEDDDNGLHRIGSARCYMQEAAPTGLFDSHSGINLITDLTDFIVGTGEGALANTASGAAGAAVEDDVGHGRCWIDTDGADGRTNDECVGAADPTACCTAADTGTCDLDDNKMYTYLGVAGDAGAPPTGLVAGWQEVVATPAPVDVAGTINLNPNNYLTNGSFEFNSTLSGTACDAGDVAPTGWTEIDAGTAAYAKTDTSEGAGCALVYDDGDGGDGVIQTLTNLQASTTYRVEARVKEANSSDICTLSSTRAATNFTAVSSGTDYHTLTGDFITTSALDTVDIKLVSTDASDICNWDHVSVRRVTRPEVADAGIVAIYDTFTTSPATADSACVGNLDPIDCCTGSGTGNCDIDATMQKVPGLSISFNPPTPGWIVQVGASVSLGCGAGCGFANSEDAGYSCQLAKDGTLISGTLMGEIPTQRYDNEQLASDLSLQAVLNTIEINPVPGTDIVYTVECREEEVNDLLYNFSMDSGGNTTSNLWMMAYPPH